MTIKDGVYFGEISSKGNTMSYAFFLFFLFQLAKEKSSELGVQDPGG